MSINTDWKGPLYLSIAAAIWGGMYVASKYALDTIPPFTLLFIRYLVAAVILVAWCRRLRIPVLPQSDRGLLFRIGFFGYFLSIASQFIGTRLSTAHLGAAITTLSPVFQSGFAVWLLGAAMSRRQGAALLLSGAGVLVIAEPAGLGRGETLNPGNLFLLVAAGLWGYYSVLAKQAAERHSSLQITTVGILWAALFSLPAALAERSAWDPAALRSVPVWLSVAYVSVIATTVAYYCWNKGLALTNPHRAGLFFFLQPVVGTLLGWGLLGETLTVAFGAGSLLILAGVYLSLDNPKARAVAS
jgi:drug/metabolite transporter (DMT)-like permease